MPADGHQPEQTEHATVAHRDGTAHITVASPRSPAGARRSPERPPAGAPRVHRRVAVLGLVAVLVVVLATVLISHRPATSPAPAAGAGPELAAAPVAPAIAVVAAQRVSPTDLAALPPATTFGTVPDAPADPNVTTVPTGLVVHPTMTAAVYAAPGGPAIAALPVQQPTYATGQQASDTWVPVIAEQPGWVQVLLASRPNGSTGWLALDSTIHTASTPYRIEVNRASFTLRLVDQEVEIGRWTVGIGKPKSVTPQGRTFIVSSIKDSQPTFSPIILPLGVHSDTYQTYGGGPGTVAVHGWPTPSVFGTASSDGCIRVPAAALAAISSTVPLGTPVLIT
jgi:lipoprotein-anchoring transpeptidase ErfK/SrfK